MWIASREIAKFMSFFIAGDFMKLKPGAMLVVPGQLPGTGSPSRSHGMFADVNMVVRAYWRFISAPGGAVDGASG